MTKLENFPGKHLIKRWLKAGGYFDTEFGTPQGGIISPLLCNMALDGLESELGVKYRIKKTKNYPFYRITLNDYSSVKSKHPRSTNSCLC